jgi:hypothetical protein
MKLELKKEEIIPYLPYDLKVMDLYDNKERVFAGYSFNHTEPVKISVYKNLLSTGRLLSEVKPILRPLSDLTIDEEFYSSFFTTFSDEDNVGYICESKSDVSNQGLSYSCILFLIENHFDVFGLIEKGLAIDINTI